MKRTISLFLAFVLMASLLLSAIPMNAFATGTETVTVHITDQDGNNVWSGNAPKGEPIVTWLDANATSHISKEGFTADKWYNKDSGLKFDANAVFQGWTNVMVKYTANNSSDSSNSSNTTTPETVTVQVFDQDGNKICTGTAPKGAQITSWLDTNVTSLIGKTGYTADKWYNKDTGAKFAVSDTFSGWTNVLVKYQANECKVVVKAVVNGDKNLAKTVAEIDAAYGDDLFTKLNGITLESRTGYKLDKWFNWDNYGTKFTEGTKITGWTNVYVTYTSNTYKLYLDPVDGKVTPGYIDVTYDKAIGLLPIPTRENYAFRGWFWDSACTQMVNTSAKYDKLDDSTVYAKWELAEVVKLYIYTDVNLKGDPVATFYMTDKIKGDVVDLTKLDIASFYKPGYSFTVKGFYNDGGKNLLNSGKPATSLTSIEVNGWTNLYILIQKTQSNQPTTPTKPSTGDNPPTGDNSNVGFMAAVMLTSAVALTGPAVLYRNYKKKTAKKQ